MNSSPNPQHKNYPHQTGIIFSLIILLSLVGSASLTYSQGVFPTGASDSVFQYDEVTVVIMVEKLGNFYLDILYAEDDRYFLQVEELFKTLRIACHVSQKGDSIGGFIDTESNPYVIDYKAKQIRSGGKTLDASRGLIKESGFVFVESTLFPAAFKLNLTFNARSLAIALKAGFELPILKQMRQESIRANLNRFTADQKADTTVQRTCHYFRGGTADWSVSSAQTWNGTTDMRLHLGGGAEFLYGETDISLDYYNQQPLTSDQLKYHWRWVDNDKKFIRQAQMGTINTQSIAFLNSTFIGASVRNSPTTLRKASGTYTLKDVTEPDWIVELYINNMLVDFTKSDASGQYMFNVPLVYGFTTIKLRFYGPMGEERTEERMINVPYSIMPGKEYEYGLTAGILQNQTLDRFARFDFNYGVNRFITAGVGIEYLSSLASGPWLPFLKLTLQPLNRITLNAEYVHGVKSGFVINGYLPAGINLEVNHSRFVKGQTAIPFKPLTENKLFLALPFRLKIINGFARLDVIQSKYSNFTSTQALSSLSIYYQQFNIASTTQVTWVDRNAPYILSDLALSLRLNRGYTCRLSSQYNFPQGRFATVRTELEKRIDRGTLTVFYERNVLYSSNSLNVSLRYDLPFARTGASFAYNQDQFVTSQIAQGGVATGGGNHFLYTNYNGNVGKGGLALVPFLDRNANGKRDPNERAVKVDAVKVMGSNIHFSPRDSVIRVTELNPFIYYLIEFNNNDLPTMTWRFTKKSWSVMVDPNQFKMIEIPIVAVGEINGQVLINRKGTLRGLGRILINIYEKESRRFVTRILTESDGSIYYLGLLPGEYIALVDQGQMDNLGLRVDPPEVGFTVGMSEEGDIIDGINFTINE
jgi:hypothetical protein